ncbi:MAG: hypothetical protein ABIO17_02870 [Pseudoxanthomonas sp.]
MNTQNSFLFGALILSALAMTGCKESTSPPSTGAAPASAPVDAAGPALAIDAPIAAENVDLSYTVVSGPLYDKANDAVSYSVEVQNNGKDTLSSAGTHPVNIGLAILGKDGTMNTPPASLEFQRYPLPTPLATGDKLLLPLSFPVTPTLGGTAQVDGVQEGVAWFSSYGQPTLRLDTFTRCGDKQESVCGSNGEVVPTAP